jgi:tetratricopeptide (TPR) repeat protein
MMLWKYLIYVFLPFPQSVFHDIAPAKTLFEIRPILALIGFGALIAALCRWPRETRDWRYGLLWWIVALFPASNLVIPIGTIFAERFLYLPGLFLYVAAAETARRWLVIPTADPSSVQRRWMRSSVTALVVIGGVYVALFITTVRRNADWQNDLTLWESVLRHYPDSFVAAAPYASALAKASRYEEALKHLRKSEEGLSKSPKVYQQVFAPKLEKLRTEIVMGLDRQKYFSEMETGRKLVLQGQPKQALVKFEELGSKYPQFSEAEESIGDVYFKLGNDLGAIQHYQKAILISPDRAVLFGKMAQTLARAGARDRAIEMYERSLILNPADPITNYNIAVLWNDINQVDKSIYYMERAIEAYAAFTAARLNLASLYKTKGRTQDAVTQVQEVLKLDPQNVQAQKLLRKLTRKPEDSEKPEDEAAAQVTPG